MRGLAAAPVAAAACMDKAVTSPPFQVTSPGKALLASHSAQEPGFEDRCCCSSSFTVVPARQAFPKPGPTPLHGLLAPAVCSPHALFSNNMSRHICCCSLMAPAQAEGRGHRLALDTASVPRCCWSRVRPSQLQLVGHGLPSQPGQQVVGCQHRHGTPCGVRGAPDVRQDHCRDREGHCSPRAPPAAPFRAVRGTVAV